MNTKAAVHATALLLVGLSTGFLMGKQCSALPPPASQLNAVVDAPAQIDRTGLSCPLSSTTDTAPPSLVPANIPAIALVRRWKSRTELEQVDPHTNELLVSYEASFPGLWHFKTSEQLA